MGFISRTFWRMASLMVALFFWAVKSVKFTLPPVQSPNSSFSPLALLTPSILLSKAGTPFRASGILLPFKPCDCRCRTFRITATALLSLVRHFTAVHKQPVSVSFDTPRITFQRCNVSVGR